VLNSFSVLAVDMVEKSIPSRQNPMLSAVSTSMRLCVPASLAEYLQPYDQTKTPISLIVIIIFITLPIIAEYCKRNFRNETPITTTSTYPIGLPSQAPAVYW
jgi:hypothetical protein